MAKAEQTALLKPAEAHRLLGWIEDLAGCNQEELAERAGLTSRWLRNFAAGRGGRRTIERLAGAILLPLWVVHDLMLPAIATVERVWMYGRAEPMAEHLAFVEVRKETLALAARISLMEFHARRSRNGIGVTQLGRGRPWAGLHPVDARVLIGWLQARGGRTRRELAARAGLSHETLRMYESGEWPLIKPKLWRLAEGAGLPHWIVEGVMLPAITTTRLVAENVRRDLPMGDCLPQGSTL